MTDPGEPAPVGERDWWQACDPCREWPHNPCEGTDDDPCPCMCPWFWEEA